MPFRTSGGELRLARCLSSGRRYLPSEKDLVKFSIETIGLCTLICDLS